MSQPIEAAMIGAGNRGYYAYGPYALQRPDEIRFTAVVEPHDERRRRFAQAHEVPKERQFHTWEDFFAQGQIAQALVNCTLDRMHLDSTLPALELGYDVLLEKPMSNTLAGNVHLVQTAEKHNRLLMICHVLRYTAFFSVLHDIVASGRLGQVITVEHRENVVFWHMAHSFVRGNWRNSQVESPMILAKCCHDLDILFWNLGPVRQLDSFGSLIHYRAENAPPGAPDRCTDGCPAADDCPFYAPRLYLADQIGWPVSVISEDLSLEARRRALETGPYGRCVYGCDNDVVDHQTVNIEFESGATGVLFMHGHSHKEGRTMRYDGTRATLRGKFGYGHGDAIEIHDHLTGRVEQIDLLARAGQRVLAAGHGGGDVGVMAAFVKALRDPGAGSTALTTSRESLESHLMAFAAEEARVRGNVIHMDDFRHRAEAVTWH
ncbi:MAG: Gfo/Idh/MocA family oxidoreductase [Anaerolineae bacterium]|nr:MAG: Gfo/Idh/MocA family oxidoreductase [Anaerolineae bacterium]